ncbi:M23 family metallopeptidase [Arthrobacter sp. NPDC058192]|uniref:M23 family metallopeptidase n=1 Tax=Arthrobacter sp. NPDC058192 TaxID=3346372 RepID=UPI0036F0DB73
MCLSLAVLAFGGFQGLRGIAPYSAPAVVPAAGSVGPQTLDPSAHAVAAPATTSAGTSGTVTADAQALVGFSRSTVGTLTREGKGGELNVASASLKRPLLGFLMAPLESLVPSSPFGLRTSPLTGAAGEFHWGQDFAAACGTRVYSADAGVVRAVGWHPWGGGNRVEIDHGNGLITTYNHLEAIAVKKGDSVRVGEVIARVGTTGSSTGCHLHFETILNGSHTDPRDWTLIPIKQIDQLGPIEMTSYAPDAGKPSNTTIGWAVPVREDLTHVVAGGVQEQPAAVAAKPHASASAAATEAASGTATPTPTGTPATPTPTPSGTPASPKPTPTPTPTPSGPPASPKPTPTPSGTPASPKPTPTPSGTPASPKPTPTGTTATPTPTPTGTPVTPGPTGTGTATPSPTPTPTRTSASPKPPVTPTPTTTGATATPTGTSTATLPPTATAPVPPSVTPRPSSARASASATATEAADATSSAPVTRPATTTSSPAPTAAPSR